MIAGINIGVGVGMALCSLWFWFLTENIKAGYRRRLAEEMLERQGLERELYRTRRQLAELAERDPYRGVS